MSEDLLALTAQIVSAHVKKNTVEVGDLPALIRDVFRTLSGLGETAPPPVADAAKPAVPATKSVFASHIVCMEYGEDDHVETAPDDRARPFDRSVPFEIQPARDLSDGRARLCQNALLPRQTNGAGQKPRRRAEESRPPQINRACDDRVPVGGTRSAAFERTRLAFLFERQRCLVEILS